MTVNQPMIAGIDIGTTKVSLVVGVLSPENKLEIVGVGTAPNTGIRHGVVVNVEATTDSICKARDEAELMSGYKIEEVFVGISGSHIKSFDSKGMVAIKNKEVTSHDVQRVIEAAKAIAVPTDRTVLHVLPREFKVDDQNGILDPIGMSGVRLESNVHIVTAGSTAISNNLKCIEKSGLKVAGIFLEQLAAARAILSEDEKALGVCLVDMGGSSCNLIYYINGSVAHTSLIPVGGNHFTHDIAVGLRTPQVSAEELKKKYGCAMTTLVPEEDVMEVEGVGGRNPRVVLRREIAEVIEPRAEEILQLIQNDMRMSGLLPLLGSGVVLTGGASQMEGLVEMGEFIFDIPVRKGLPNSIGGLADVVRSGAFATSVGLVLLAYDRNKNNLHAHKEFRSNWNEKFKSFFDKIF